MSREMTEEEKSMTDLLKSMKSEDPEIDFSTKKKPRLQLPTVGRMVHFFPVKYLSEGWGGRETVYPAIVVIYRPKSLFLNVFTDIGHLRFESVVHKSEAFTPSGSQHSHYWDWPEIK